MSLHSWLQNLRSALAPRRGQRHHMRRGSLRAAMHRPSLEVLEDRRTPSFGWGGYLSEPPPGVEWAPPPPLLADFTSDGILDRLRNFFDRVAVEPGLGDGSFGDPIISDLHAGSLAVADFNGDGRLDVVGTYVGWGAGEGYGSVQLGRGDGTFYGLEELGVNSEPWEIGTVDYDGDGHTDVVLSSTVNYPPYSGFEVFINDGNWPPRPRSLRIGNATVTEGNTGTTAANFTVTLSEASTETVTVAYATGNGDAIAGSDYQAASGTLTFAPGETSKTITVLVNGDRLGEPNEKFVVNLSSPTNATISDGYGEGTIVNDEPRVSISNVTQYEGKKGQKTLFTFTVTLSAAYDQPVTVSYRTADGTAKSGEDYVAQTGTLTFAPGETSKTITVTVKGDGKREADETFYLDLSVNSGNSLLVDGRGIGTILNDD